MKIVIVADHAYITGGQSKVAIESALGLAARGAEVVFFASVGPVDPRLAAAGIDTVCLNQGDLDTASKPAFLAQMLWNTEAARRLGGLLATCDPAASVVHVHAFAKALSPSIARPLLASRVPRVYTLHEFFLACPNGGFYDYPRHTTCHRTPLSLSCITTNCDSRSYAWKLPRLLRHGLIEAGGLKRAFPHVITISQLQYEVIKPFLPSRTRWHRVGNPIEAENCGPKTQAGEKFLYVGRLSPEKGVAHFCAASQRVGVTPVIVGDGPQRAQLEAEFPQAEFLGWKSPAEVRDLMRAARALVFPSVWYEGQPLTTYEALATGTPVIVSDVCAGRESVEHGVNGLWFASADVEALTHALRQLADPLEAARMSANAHRIYWASPQSLDVHLDKLEAVYRALLASVPDAS